MNRFCTIFRIGIGSPEAILPVPPTRTSRGASQAHCRCLRAFRLRLRTVVVVIRRVVVGLEPDQFDPFEQRTVPWEIEQCLDIFCHLNNGSVEQYERSEVGASRQDPARVAAPFLVALIVIQVNGLEPARVDAQQSLTDRPAEIVDGHIKMDKSRNRLNQRQDPVIAHGRFQKTAIDLCAADGYQPRAALANGLG